MSRLASGGSVIESLWMRRLGIWIFLLWLSSPTSWGNEAHLLARIHVEAIGGEHRLAALKSLKVKGHVDIDDRRLYFTLWAERPNRLRMETRSSDRVLIQGTDGVNQPWEMDPEAEVPKPQPLIGDEAREFSGNSEFDDPLVDFEKRGYTLDYAGTTKWQGRQSHRIFVTRGYVDGFYLFLDAENYFITGKQWVRKTDYGREIEMAIVYGEFRPVSGLIMPHRFVTTADEKLLYESVLQKVEPNAPLPEEGFSMPVVP